MTTLVHYQEAPSPQTGRDIEYVGMVSMELLTRRTADLLYRDIGFFLNPLFIDGPQGKKWGFVTIHPP